MKWGCDTWVLGLGLVGMGIMHWFFPPANRTVVLVMYLVMLFLFVANVLLDHIVNKLEKKGGDKDE